jgi:anti-sigma factor RsiW
MSDDDDELVALIDNELDEDRKARLLARIENDDALRARYEALRDGVSPIRSAFDALLERAPVERLRLAIPPELEPQPAIRRRWLSGISFRDLAAGLVVGFLAAGALAWFTLGHLARSEDEGDWRGAVVDYMKLYTNETFALVQVDPQTEAQELGAVSKRVGASLTPDNVALPGVSFKVAFILAFAGAPLGEIAYVDPTGEPVLFCVTANSEPDAPPRTEKRDAFALASWSRGGRGYLVISRKPEQQVAELARTLEARF